MKFAILVALVGIHSAFGEVDGGIWSELLQGDYASTTRYLEEGSYVSSYGSYGSYGSPESEANIACDAVVEGSVTKALRCFDGENQYIARNGNTCNSACQDHLATFPAACTGSAFEQDVTRLMNTAFDCSKKREIVLPSFNLADFEAELQDLTVVDPNTVVWATSAPTPTPTLAPVSGYQTVAVQQEQTIVKASIPFPLTSAQASDPRVKASLESGFASSIGLPAETVRVSKIGVNVVLRRLTASIDIEFEVILAGSADDASELGDTVMSHITAAGNSGAIVANIIKAAADNNVLTPALSTMSRQITVEAVKSVVTVTVQQHVKITNAPTPVPPTPSPPTPSPTPGDVISPDSAATSASVCPAFVGLIAIFVVSMASAF